jgi:hypothetical protein
MIDRDLLALAVVAAAIIPTGALTSVAYQRMQCSGYEEVTGRATRFEGFQCYVSDGKTWYSMDEYRSRPSTVASPTPGSTM